MEKIVAYKIEIDADTTSIINMILESQEGSRRTEPVRFSNPADLGVVCQMLTMSKTVYCQPETKKFRIGGQFDSSVNVDRLIANNEL